MIIKHKRKPAIHTLVSQLVGEAIDLQAVSVNVVPRLSRVAILERTEAAPTQTAFALVIVGLAVGVWHLQSAVGALEHRIGDQVAHSITGAEVRQSEALGALGVDTVCRQ